MGAAAGLANNALSRECSVTADDRTSSASNLSPTTGSSAHSRGDTQSASFDLGDLRVELTASPGAARVVVAAGEVRDIYVVDPAALAAWSRSVERLLTLIPAATERDWVEYRSPFLIDREGRASIAVEGLVAATVAYRLIVHGADSLVAGIMTTRETIRGLADAAAGAVAVAGSRGPLAPGMADG